MARAAVLAAVGALLAVLAGARAAQVPNSPLVCASQVVLSPPTATPQSSSRPLLLRRRDADEPFFAFDPPSDPLVTSLINSMATMVEAATGRRLFPLRAQMASPAAVERACGAQSGPKRPPVSWDPATNRMVVRAGDFANGAVATLAVLAPLALDVARRVVGLGGGIGVGNGGASAAVAAVRAAVTAALASAALTIPLWQCIACVAILGLVFPLAINAALGAAVDAACNTMALDPQSCFDLALGALFAGVVLAALSSVPIFKLCRLAQCRRAGVGVAGFAPA